MLGLPSPDVAVRFARSSVMIVDDHRQNVTLLERLLRGVGVERVAGYTDPRAALAACARSRPDLVLLDLHMPGLDGIAVLEELRASLPDGAFLPVIVLTADITAEARQSALAAGAKDFLTKPFDRTEVILRVNNLLETGALHRRLEQNNAALAASNHEVSVRLAETELERERVRAILAALPQGLVVVDDRATVTHVNDRLAELIGVPAASLLGRPVSEAARLLRHDGTAVATGEGTVWRQLWSGEAEILGTAFDLYIERGDGVMSPVTARTAPIRDASGAAIGAVGVLEDVRALSAHDPVTRLPGHGQLADWLRDAGESDGDRDRTTALLVIAIDRFRRLRTALPADAFDRVVSTVADRLRGAMATPGVQRRSTEASAAYLGNGEMAVVTGVESESDAILVGERIAEGLAGSVAVEQAEVEITVSVAVATVPPEVEPARLVSAVAAAARSASEAGGNRVTTSAPDLHAAVAGALRLEHELREAIDSGAIVAHYQPQVDLRGGATVAVEALVRWQHPERGLVGAQEIIPLAAESDLLGALGWSVLDQACRQTARWRRELPGGQDLAVSVNVAADQLSRPDFVDRVGRAVQAAGLEPGALVLEITEGSVMGDSAVVRERLAEVKALGVRIALDDFGTGYSSMRQLRALPVDILKIDQGFVAGMVDEPADAAIVAGTVRLARTLGLEVVAEGVETHEQLVQLRVLGCDLAQGFLWSRPIPATELAEWWADRSATPVLGGAAPLPEEDTSDVDDTIAYLIHELRSPLTAISGFAELLAASPLPEATVPYVETIVRNATDLGDRLAQITESRDVLEGGLRLTLEDCDLGDVVTSLVHDLTPQLGPHPIELEVEAAATIAIDRARIVQALTNLLTNAAKFSPPQSAIEVSVRVADRHVTVAVRDGGPGIPAHRRHELFRRFSRLGSRTKGMGIGLFLARLVAVAHGGTLEHEPAPGTGSVFSIRLPLETVRR